MTTECVCGHELKDHRDGGYCYGDRGNIDPNDNCNCPEFEQEKPIEPSP